MNERIKLPAQEWLGYDPDRGDIHGYTFEQMREFVELIIKECATIADKWVDDTDNGQNYPSEMIKQYFGVKE
jgi:lysylphosphatidylglycerol synthetase-like protein (DUF2156 family)